jgi:hypothetical protein
MFPDEKNTRGLVMWYGNVGGKGKYVPKYNCENNSYLCIKGIIRRL